MLPITTNYERERALFTELLNPASQKRILLLCGESGIGKSTLLRSCVELMPPSVKCVPVELRGGAVGIAEIFYRLGGRLGWSNLIEFRRQLLSIDSPQSTQIGRNWLAGIRNQINVSLYSHNLIDRSDRVAALTEALFADLEHYRELIVFTFDTFDTASTEVSEWLAGPLLERVARSRGIRAVVAGKTVPDINNIEWGNCCGICRLSGINHAEHWLPITDDLGKLVPHEPRSWLSGVCDALGGNPAKIMQIIESLPSKE